MPGKRCDPQRNWLNRQSPLFAAARLFYGAGLADNSVDFIVTDPPYFDSVQYSDLAAFFRVWLRQLLPDAAVGAMTCRNRPWIRTSWTARAATRS
jgi:adenine-specific DNA methylase